MWHPLPELGSPASLQSITLDHRAMGTLGFQSVTGERLRILVSRGTEGARTWRHTLQMAQDPQCQGDGK